MCVCVCVCVCVAAGFLHWRPPRPNGLSAPLPGYLNRFRWLKCPLHRYLNRCKWFKCPLRRHLNHLKWFKCLGRGPRPGPLGAALGQPGAGPGSRGRQGCGGRLGGTERGRGRGAEPPGPSEPAGRMCGPGGRGRPGGSGGTAGTCAPAGSDGQMYFLMCVEQKEILAFFLCVGRGGRLERGGISHQRTL